MIDNNCSMTSDSRMDADKYANVINQLHDKSQDEHILSCFMQQSAYYLGTDYIEQKTFFEKLQTFSASNEIELPLVVNA